jgi:phosphoribosylaminoimidazolecarboxamide formyltransferase/IMP cyclohydrolase
VPNRALLSVYDKTGVVDLARGLVGLGWELVSSGGTARAIADAGLPVTDVAELTGFPAILGHRVVTLHPAVHAGLLANLHEAEHRADLERMGYAPISLAVVNLYPFTANPGIELIDVGGPTMVRAAAKNHAHVGVVTQPSQYAELLDELRSNANALSAATRRRLARDAFAHTAAYDAAIVSWFDDEDRAAGVGEVLPRSLHYSLVRAQELRYGENPHQQGARYRIEGRRSWWDDAVQHGGKELSYLNLFDTEAAWTLANSFDSPGVVVVKHANPCGVAVAGDIATAYVRANACDPVSAFGGIVAANRPVTRAMAEALAPVFTEVVVAPAFDDDALTILTAKKNLRVLSAPEPYGASLDLRSIDGGLLVQQVDPVSVDRSLWRVVTEAQPDAALWGDIVFGWQVCAAVSSNAIVLAKDRQAFGIGAGQQNRLDSARIAQERAAGRASGGVCASDAFFPFRDGLDAVASAGVRAVVQPGGSVRDDEVIAAANEHGIAMVFTGERHFRH